jgi:hypothetical protein
MSPGLVSLLGGVLGIPARVRKPPRTRHHSFFDFRPKASIVELDPAGVTFRLNKILLHLLRELCFFGCDFAAGSLMVRGKLRRHLSRS